MKKQEALKMIEAQKETIVEMTGWAMFKYTKTLIEQLYEPQRATIPQYIADKIEYARKYDYTIFDAMMMTERDDDFYDWLYTDDNIEVFARAWLDGYKVEKEKRYKVVMPNVSSSGGVLTRIKHNDSWIWIDTLGTIVEGRTHTRKELEEAGFGWVFDCEGVEVEEVTE